MTLRPALLTALIALTAPLVLSGPSVAMPEDPPIVVVSPATGVSLPVNGDGIPVVYQCPVYHTFDGEPPFGGRDQYNVRFATSPTVGPDGILTDVVGLAGPDSVQDSDLPASTCRGYLTGTASTTPGTYYWQVTRICVGCPNGYDEHSSVRTFTLTLAGAGLGLRLKTVRKPYVGFPGVATVRTKGIGTGSLVSVEGRTGNKWKTLGQGNVVGGRALVPVKPSAKVTAMRAVFAFGESITSKAVPVAPRPARSWPQGGTWAGAWKGDVSVSGQQGRSAEFSVANGRPPVLREGKFLMTLLCPTPGQTSPFTIQVVTVFVNKAKLDPDGRFVYAQAKQTQSVLLFGRLKGRKGNGEIHMTLGTCAGSAKLSLRHR